MNFMEYEKQKVKQLSCEDLSWKLFALTGQVNYYLLYSSLNDVQKEHKWTSSKSAEL